MNNSDTQPQKNERLEIPARKVKMFMVNPAAFMSFFTKGFRFKTGIKVKAGIPEDAQLVHVGYDTGRNGIIFVIESESYKPIPITAAPPVELIEIDWGSLKKKK